MRLYALTGGIATGKSTAVEIMRCLDPRIVFFDCDKSVRDLLKRPEVLAEITDVLGEGVVNSAGELERARLRELVFGDHRKREELEALLHPKVRKECLEKREKCFKNSSTTTFIADVPLLFESGFDFDQDLNLVVATSEATQRDRLLARSHFEEKIISSILNAQLPIMEKVHRGDIVFWNEGSKVGLKKQLSRFLYQLKIS